MCVHMCVYIHTYVEFFSDRDQTQTLRGSKQHCKVWGSEQLDSSAEARATQQQQEQVVIEIKTQPFAILGISKHQ